MYQTSHGHVGTNSSNVTREAVKESDQFSQIPFVFVFSSCSFPLSQVTFLSKSTCNQSSAELNTDPTSRFLEFCSQFSNIKTLFVQWIFQVVTTLSVLYNLCWFLSTPVIPVLKEKYTYVSIVLSAVCLIPVVCWFVYRKEDCAWILQDIMGAAFCISMLKIIHMPNFMVSIIWQI